MNDTLEAQKGQISDENDKKGTELDKDFEKVDNFEETAADS